MAIKRFISPFFTAILLVFSALVFSNTALAQPVPADVDYEVTVMQTSSNPITAGLENIEYVFTVTNISGNNAEFDANLTLTLNLPGDSTVVVNTITPSANSFVDPTWNVGPLAAGASATLTVSLYLGSAAADGSQVSAEVALASAGDNDTNGANDSASVITDIVRVVNFLVDVTESIDPVIAGSGGGTVNLSYDVTIFNVGPSDAASLVPGDLSFVFDTTLPAGVTIDSFVTADGPYTPLEDGQWNLVNGLTTTTQATGTLNLIVDPTAVPGTDVIGLTVSLNSTVETQGPNEGASDTELTSIVNSVEFDVTKVFTDGAADSVDVTFVCSSGTPSAAGATISPAAGTTFTLENFDPATSCLIEETTVPGGYAVSYSADCAVDPVSSGSSYNCEITNSPTRATFRVTKFFADGNNVDEVTVSIDCNTGLILDQDKLLSHQEWVEFVVTDYTDGNLSCTITEDGETGYSGEYNNITLATVNDESCAYPEISGADAAFECEITNSPDPVDIVINKQWIIEGTADAVDLEFGLDLYCQASGMSGAGAHNDGGNNWHGYDFSEGDDTFTWQIIPLFPTSTCYVEEYGLGSYVEVDNPCSELVVSAGNGAECTITNTVFFEGIPTLSQYGMAILALLMLGVGMVSFRRFS